MSPRFRLDFFNDGSQYRIRDKNRIRQVVKWLVLREGFRGADICVVIVSDDFLYDYNMKYLKHDTLTDVITFDFTEVNSNIAQGEIYISIDRVGENAREFGVKKDKELRRVIFHGVLHLCGYKDKTKVQKLSMTEKEDECLKKFDSLKTKIKVSRGTI